MSRYRRWRFSVVLLATLLLVVFQPIVSGLVDERSSFDVFFSLLIGAVLLSLFEEKQHRITALALAVPAFVATWLSYGIGGLAGRVTLVAGCLFSASFFGFALYGILRRVLVNRVSGDALFGAVCGYLLLGVIWGGVYAAAETIRPGSFHVGPHAAGIADPRQCRGILSYYSFVTLTTVGYGDITPATPTARTLAWMEAMAGQVYLVVLVAGLVGLKVAQASKD
jgi:voltage-gated potassium channel